ncbi:MAG: winged helix-turn-helix transcriptional regulator [Erysipelotrichaceae bacterium]|nr:winged helix-turn-helix transcriptional regulator [Erysipelotrichaceae bacterium]
MNKTNREYINEYNQLYKECNLIYHKLAIKLGISDCTFWIFYVLSDKDKTYTQSEICQLSSMPIQTVNTCLKNLEKNEYLILHHIQGQRGKMIQLTLKGNNFINNHIIPIKLAEEKACDLLSDDDKEKFIGTLHILIDGLYKELS